MIQSLKRRILSTYIDTEKCKCHMFNYASAHNIIEFFQNKISNTIYAHISTYFCECREKQLTNNAVV